MDPIKKIEARLINLQLSVLSLKYSHPWEQNKGQLVDMEYAMQETGLSRVQLIKALSKTSLPIYFFAGDLKSFQYNQEKAKRNRISETVNSKQLMHMEGHSNG